MSTEQVLQIAQKYLHNVKTSGSENIMATCPFHAMGDRITNTFTMSLTRGVYFCFSCRCAGNLHTFLRDMGLPRNVIELKYRYLMEELDKTKPKDKDPLRPSLYSNAPLPEGLLGLFEYAPIDLLRNGFTEETLRHFDVGYDQWHERVTFPLRDLKGHLVGISGRTIYEDFEPRYKVYGYEFEAWGLPRRDMDRFSILWNAHAVYPSIFFQRSPDVILVEGFKACMWLVQSGFKNTVALLGSYLTDEHQWILERMGARIFVMLDNDAAGHTGREYIGRTLSRTNEVRIVEYPEKQPDGLKGQEAVGQALDGAMEYHRWSIQRLEAGNGIRQGQGRFEVCR